jgi:hypothetical protein
MPGLKLKPKADTKSKQTKDALASIEIPQKKKASIEFRIQLDGCNRGPGEKPRNPPPKLEPKILEKSRHKSGAASYSRLDDPIEPRRLAWITDP